MRLCFELSKDQVVVVLQEEPQTSATLALIHLQCLSKWRMHREAWITRQILRLVQVLEVKAAPYDGESDSGGKKWVIFAYIVENVWCVQLQEECCFSLKQLKFQEEEASKMHLSQQLHPFP